MKKTISLKLAKKIQKVAEKKGIKLPESGQIYSFVSADNQPVITYLFRNTKDFDVKDFNLFSLLPEKYVFKKGGSWVKKHCQKFNFFAYDTTELLEMLPAFIEKGTKTFNLNLRKTIPYFYCFYSNIRDREEFLFEFDTAEAPTPTEALGKMLLYLLENDLIKKLDTKNL